MDAEKRLTWLSEIARFVYQARGLPYPEVGEAGILSIESSGIPLGLLQVFGVPGLGTKSEASPPRNLGI